MSIGALSMIAYAFGTVPMLHVMTSDPDVIKMASRYIPWIVFMPLAGCAAFTWDGIYIGAVAARPMRNSMLWATAVFFVCCYGFLVLSGNIHIEMSNILHSVFPFLLSCVVQAVQAVASKLAMLSASAYLCRARPVSVLACSRPGLIEMK